MKRVLPVTGLSQAPLQLEASLKVRFDAPFVGHRNGEHHAVQPEFLKSTRDDLARHARPNALAPVALFSQQDKVRWSGNSGQNRVLTFERHERQSPTCQTSAL